MSTLSTATLMCLLTPSSPVGSSLLGYQGGYGMPVLIQGPPGVGKTTTLKDLGWRLGIPTHVFHTESAQVSDREGVLVGDGHGGVRRATDNHEVLRMFEQGTDLLIFDEINTGNEKLDGAIRRVLFDRVFARRTLPPGVAVMATCNPPEISMSGRPLSPPLANTLVHLDSEEHTTDDWLAYMQDPRVRQNSGALSHQQLQEALMDGWGAAYDTTLQRHSFFLRNQPKWLNNPPQDPEKLSRSWPSERSHSMALNLLTTCQVFNETSAAHMLLQGCVGKDAADAYFASLTDMSLPSVEEVLSGRWSPGPRSDITYAVVSAVTSRLSRKLRQESQITVELLDLAYQAWQLADKLVTSPHVTQDLALPLAKLLNERGYSTALQLRATDPRAYAISDITSRVMKHIPSIQWSTKK